MPTPTNPDNTQLLIEMAKRQLSKEMPKEVQMASIVPANRSLGHAEAAYTTPDNTIHYNPSEFQHLDLETMKDLLVHELTHVRQNAEVPLWKRIIQTFTTSPDDLPYGQDPNELEAYQTTRDRQLKDGRRPQFANVQFDQSAPIRVDDINLPPEKK